MFLDIFSLGRLLHVAHLDGFLDIRLRGRNDECTLAQWRGSSYKMRLTTWSWRGSASESRNDVCRLLCAAAVNH